MRKHALLFALMICGLALPATALEFGGNAELSGAADVDGGDIYRRLARADLVAEHASGTTSIKLDLRAEYDSARSSSAAFFNYLDQPVSANGNLSHDYPDTAAALVEDKNEAEQQRMYLRELYINHDLFFENADWLSFNFRAGRMIHTWGVADEVKPTDIICPQDYSFFVMRKIQDRKYGVWSATASMSLFEAITLEGIAVPEFKADEPWSASFQQGQLARLESLMRSYNVRLESPLEPGDGEHSDDTLRQSNYGGRLGLRALGFDLHGMYFYGYDHLPVFELHSSGFDPAKLTTSAGLIDPFLQPEYKRLQMYGADIQRALPFGIGVRAEAAFFNHGKYFMLSDKPRTSTEELTDIANRNADKMTGIAAVDQGIMTVLSVPLLEDLANNGTGFREKKLVEYTAGFDVIDLFTLQGLYLNLQFNQKIILDHDEELADKKFRNMGTAQLKYSLLRETLGLIAESSYGITANDIYARFAVEYALSENCRITAGYTLFEALEDSDESKQGYFGQFDRQDFVAAGITYTM